MNVTIFANQVIFPCLLFCFFSYFLIIRPEILVTQTNVVSKDTQDNKNFLDNVYESIAQDDYWLSEFDNISDRQELIDKLIAIARGVISSLWVADDLAAILLSTFYYQLRKEGQSRSASLQQAQQRLRNLTGQELAGLFESDIKSYLDYFKQQRQDSRKAHSKANREFNKFNKLDPKGEECRYWYKEKRKRKKKANRDHDTLNYFEQFLCQKEFPFANPYYWAVFICSGSA